MEKVSFINKFMVPLIKRQQLKYQIFMAFLVLLQNLDIPGLNIFLFLFDCFLFVATILNLAVGKHNSSIEYSVLILKLLDSSK